MMGFVGIASSRQAHFIGIASGDTVFAGPGDVKYDVAPGHFGPPVDRRIYGQRVAVERVGGPAADQLRGFSHVVLVPWDYAADCTPTPWARSARWVDADTRGFFIARLRDKAHWSEGVPTFDVFTPEMYPYPQRVGRMLRGQAMASIMDLDQVFALADLLPGETELRDSAEIAAAPLFAWARSNPGLAQRYPASEVIRMVRYSVGVSRLKRIRSPIAGTYRFTTTLPDGKPRTYYVRTRSVPTSAFNLIEPEQRLADPTEIRKPAGYYMLVSAEFTPDSLPTDCMKGRRPHREGYIAVLDQPATATTRGKEWRGKIEMSLLRSLFPQDSTAAQFARAEFERFSQRWRARVPAETPARFIEGSDGILRVEQEITLNDGRKSVTHGERLSSTTITCQW
jgi:hypothetical protein